MLIISNAVAARYHELGLAELQSRIVTRWRQNLLASFDEVGEAGCRELLENLGEIARDDTEMTEQQLMLLADLKLVDLANQHRDNEG